MRARLLEGLVEAWHRPGRTGERRAIEALAACIDDHLDELSVLLTREHGKPLGDARNELVTSANSLRHFAAREVPVSRFTSQNGRAVEVSRKPLGVVAAIAPFNFPVLLSMWKVGPALITGNTVVLKPSPFTPLTTLRIGELARAALPPGVLNILSGDDALGPALSGHPHVAKIAFTGSSATGKAVMRGAAEDLKRITLELGGNDPAIILGDVDVDEVAPRIFWGAFANCGQVCVAAKRIYVHDSIYDRFVEVVKDLARANLPANGETEGVRLGPVQNHVQYARVRAMIAQARAAGLDIWEAPGDLPPHGYFIAPTLALDPPDDAAVVREEPFGPFLPLMRFSEVDEVVARANDSEYGLAASVWSGDRALAESVARRLDCGTVWINNVLGISTDIPFAGHKHSGIGVENGEEGLLEYTAIQAIVG